MSRSGFGAGWIESARTLRRGAARRARQFEARIDRRVSRSARRRAGADRRAGVGVEWVGSHRSARGCRLNVWATDPCDARGADGDELASRRDRLIVRAAPDPDPCHNPSDR